MPEPPTHPAALRCVDRATRSSRVIAAAIVTDTGEIRYRRAGRGRPVVLLTSGRTRGLTSALVLQALAGRFRVVAPKYRAVPADVRPDSSAAVCVWLGDVVDGLGLERPSVVADEEFGLAALQFAMLDPARVDRLVVISGDRMPALAGRAVPDGAGVDSSLPLLLISLEATAWVPARPPDAISAMLRFLAASGE